MASVVDIAPPRPAPSPGVRRVRIASRGLEWLFAALSVFFIIFTAFILWIWVFYWGQVITIGSITNAGHPPLDFIPFRDLQPEQKLASVSYGFARGVPLICLFWCLRLLFRLYAREEVFTARNASLMKLMGVCLVMDATMPSFRHLVLGATGAEIDKMWAQMATLQELMFGIVIGVIAYVTQAGHEIEQDREGFV